MISGTRGGVDTAKPSGGSPIRIRTRLWAATTISTRLMVDYYSAIEPNAAGIKYMSGEERPIGGWDWWVERRLSNTAVPPSEISDELGTRYLLERSYPNFWLSGVVWHLYARHEDD